MPNNKAVLLSIQPVWCSKIVLKEKTVEVRKTKPEGVKTPFKCYIYCTKERSKMGWLRIVPGKGWQRLDGTVIGEFVCDKIWELAPICRAPDDVEEMACMDRDRIVRYLKYGMTVTNEAVNGATLAPNITDNVNGGIRTCISTVVTSSTALAKADYILLEGGVNDAWNKAPVGTLTDGFAATYDETTMTGALEKMLEYLAKNYSDKRVAYVFPHGGLFGSSENWYKTYKPAILAALQKWGVPYVDIAESTPPMGGHGISGLSGKYTGDGTHPNKAGYERFYVEPIAALLKRL